MGKSVTRAAAETRDRILRTLCTGRPSNVYALDLGTPTTMHGFPADVVSQVKVFHFEEDAEEHPKGEVRGSIWLHVPPNNAVEFAKVVIDADGRVVAAPFPWHRAARGNLDGVNGMIVDPDTVR